MNYRIEDADDTVEQICADLLDQLPTWFGIPESNAEYVAMARTNETLIAFGGDEAVGLLTLVHHNPLASEIHLMAVRPELHRAGIGRALVDAAEARLRGRGVRFLQVKTLADTHPDEGYAATREFYLGMGFTPLEVFTELWDPSNPALQLVKAL